MVDVVQSDIFNSSSADLVLRSAENVDFRVHRAVLVMASTVFEGMSGLPQPPSDDTKQELPFVQLNESTRTLDVLLQMIYPDKHPKDIAFAEVHKVLKAADKYDMHAVVARLGDLLRQTRYARNYPFEVFALACQYNLGDDLVRQAAEESLLHPSPLKRLGQLPPEVGGLSAIAYHSLLAYRQRCIDILRPMLETWPHPNLAYPKPVWHTCVCRLKSDPSKNPRVPKWYAEHVERTVDAFSEVVSAWTLRSPSLIDATVSQFSPANVNTSPTRTKPKPSAASGCECKESAPFELVKFHAVLADEVERQLGQVRTFPPTSCRY